MPFQVHPPELKPREAALFAAIQRGAASEALALVADGADINATQRYEVPVDRERWSGRRTPLMAAIAAGHAEMARRLLAIAGVAVDFADPLDGRTALMLAAQAGEGGLVDDLLAAGAAPAAESGTGRTAAAYAVEAGHPAIAARLIAAQGPVQSPGERAELLADAAFRGQLEIVRRLVADGADLEAPDQAGNTPLVAAAWGGRDAVILDLLALGADLAASGGPALALAANAGRTSTVRLLAARGVPFDRPDGIGWTPLISAAWQGHAETVAALLALGAARRAKDRQGKTALDWAREGGHADIVAQLA